jgi:peptidyl-prolyl cis-trans isomerase B (cyclophilin B)
MPSRKTRERQLAKLAARRAAERKRKQRQRAIAIGVAVIFSLAGLVLLAVTFLGGGDEPAATSTPSFPATPSTPTGPTPGTETVACGGTVPEAASEQKLSQESPPEMTIDPDETYVVTMETSCGTIAIQLDPKASPTTVNSVVYLVQQGFYDGLTFHRIAKDFVIQGGDPEGTGGGGPGYQTVDAPAADTKYPRGSVAMAKASQEPAGTAGSQFFIVTTDDTTLNQGEPLYAMIGSITEGMEVVDTIAALDLQGGVADGPPVMPVYILSATVATGSRSPTPSLSATVAPSPEPTPSTLPTPSPT